MMPKLSANEIEILQWAEPEGSCAIVWPTGALDTWYIAGSTLEARGLLTSIQRSPEIWVITDDGREALAQFRRKRDMRGLIEQIRKAARLYFLPITNPRAAWKTLKDLHS